MLRQYAFAAVDQLVVGATTFLLHALLIRWWLPAEYGTFGLWLAVADVFLTCHNALVTTPLSVHLARQRRRFRRRHLEALLATASMLGAAAALALGLLGALLLDRSGLLPVAAGLGGPAMIAGLLIRSHLRALFFARGDAASALLVDGAYAGAVFLALLGLGLLAGTPDAETVLLVLAAAQALPALPVFLRRGGPALAPRRRTLARYRTLWRDARWSLVGALTTTVQIRSHAFLVAAMAGAEAYGVIMAGGLLLQPTRLALQSWAVIARPAMAAAIAQGDRRRMARLQATALAAFGAGYALLIVALWLVWEPVRELFYPHFPPEIAPVVVTWVLFIGLFNIGDVFSTALQSLLQFRPLAHTTMVGAAIVLLATPLVIATLGWELALLGPCLAQLVVVVWMAVICHRSLLVLRPHRPLAEQA